MSWPRLRWAAARIARTHLPAFGLYILVTVVMTWPYTRQIQTSLYNWSDALLNTWTLAWGAHALLTDPLNLYHANIFYPYSNTLALSESLLPQTVVALPIILATNMPALAHNLLVLSSFVLAAFGMYLLVFDLTRSRAAGLVAGMIYTFTSYKMMHFAHLQLLSSQWMPFALLYLRKTLTPSLSLIKGEGRVRVAFLFAIFFSLQALSSFYYAFFIAIAVALYGVYVLVLRIWNRSAREWIAARATPTMLALALSALFTVPLSLPYFSVQRELGLERGTQDVEYYAATVRTYFSVPDGNWLYRQWLAPRARMTGSGERDFVGFVALALAFVGMMARPRRDAEKWFYLLLALFGIILSFGARNEILFFPKWPQLSLPFYLPFRYLFEWVPGFKAMRGPDRFAYLAVLGLAVIAGYGTRPLIQGIRARRPTSPYVAPFTALIVVALIGLENLAIPIRATNPATLARPQPDYTRFIGRGESDAVVLEIPMVYDNESLAWPQYYSIFHWRPLVNGFSGFFPPGYDALAGITRGFPDERSLALLNEIGVRLVVVHNDLLTPAERQGIRTRLAAFERRAVRVRHFATDDVYQLNSDERAWGAALAQSIPDGARVWLKNSRQDRREFFEIAAGFLINRQFSGEAAAAFRALAPVEPDRPADFVIANADQYPGSDFTRRVWANAYLAVYAR
jgi:hypothetical protein